MTSGVVAGVLLAAGEGRRLGMDVPKALVHVDGRPLIEHAVETLAAGGCADVVVVLGAGAARVVDQADLGLARVVENPDWREGMGSSVRTGLAALPADAEAAVLALVDQPGIGPAAVRRLIAAWCDGAEIAVATYGGKLRNPVLLDRAHWEPAAAAAVGDAGARAYVRGRADVTVAVACEDVADPVDVDTQADLADAGRRRAAAAPAGAATKGAGMQLNHSFSVPIGIEEAWQVLRDIERIGPCMPGATIDSVEGDEFTGRVKVKVGPMQVTYQGQARWVDVDEEHHRATIEARGSEARGTGTATATITAELTERDDRTEVTVFTDLAITGKPAQFGRGVMSDVGEKLLGQFADCLATTLDRTTPEEQGAEAAMTKHQEKTAADPPTSEPAFASLIHFDEAKDTADAVDLVDVAGGPLVKRALPIVGVVAALWLVLRLVRRKRR